MKYKALYFFMLGGIVAFLTGCGGSGPKIVIESYTAPKEAAKLKKIETKDEFIAQGAYLAIWLNPDVKNADKYNKKLKNMLINEVKGALTQTNFIALDPLGDENGVALSMDILSYDYKPQGDKVTLYMEVSFILSRGVEEFLVKNYHTKLYRQAPNGMELPSEDQLAATAAKRLVKYFISDISPLKTHQLREFKPFAEPLSYVVNYAKRQNYQGAIEAMQSYHGKKDANYYYNLAVLYEALASQTEDLKYLQKAKINYERAMQNGGYKDKLIVDSKARFDNFYILLHKTKKVQKQNAALLNDRNSMAGSSDDEYE